MDLSSRRNFRISYNPSFIKNLPILFCNCLIIIGLLFENEIQAQGKKPVIIDVAKAIGSEKKDFLSNYAKDILYIPLETTNESLIKLIRGVVVEKDKIYINSDGKSILIFDINGKYSGKIDRYGRGPQEYLYISSFQVDPVTGNISILSNKAIFEFDINGNLIKKTEKIRDANSLDSFFKVKDGVFLLSWIKDSLIKKDMVLLNKYSVLFNDGTFKNFGTCPAVGTDVSKAASIKSIVFNRDAYHYYKYEDRIRAERSFSDTIISFDSKFNIRPEYIFNFGKYGYNKYDYSEASKIEADAKIITKSSPVFETSYYIFIRFQFRGLDPEPFETTHTLPNGSSYTTKHTNVNAIYNKKSKELKLLKRPEKGKIGLIENIKNGPAFWPKSINSKMELISYLSASELLNHISNGGADLSKIKKDVSNLREEDNPVVLIAVPK